MKPVTFLVIGGTLAVAGLMLQSPGNSPAVSTSAPDMASPPVVSSPTLGDTPGIGGTMPEPIAAGGSAPPSIQASRLFTGRNSFPPDAFAAYGILAFDTLATSADKDRYEIICEAFFSVLINSADAGAPENAQMVTVWPVDDREIPDLTQSLNTARPGDDSCVQAVAYYDVQVAQNAIDDARRAGASLNGRGPFLLAWAPASDKGEPDAVVLAADLGNVQTAAEAKDVLRIWSDDIERDPNLWQDGFTLEKLRVKLRQVVNRHGEGLLRLFGG